MGPVVMIILCIIIYNMTQKEMAMSGVKIISQKHVICVTLAKLLICTYYILTLYIL
jgi:hypothetical protein